MSEPLLRVRNLVKNFPVRGGVFAEASEVVHAVDDVSFEIDAGETMGLVGEVWLREVDDGTLRVAVDRADRRRNMVRGPECHQAQGQGA